MTPERRQQFEAEWPDLAVRVAALLDAHGMRDGQRDDVVQETALRLFGMWDRVRPGAPVWPLARTIALNVLRDRLRRHEPEPTDALPEKGTDFDAEDVGLARVELERVRVALNELTPAQRHALLAEIGAASGGGRDDATKMLRLRARRKLTRLLQRSPVIAPLRWGRLSEIGQWIAGLREAVVQGASCLACLALGLGTVVAASPLPDAAAGEATDAPVVRAGTADATAPSGILLLDEEKRRALYRPDQGLAPAGAASTRGRRRSPAPTEDAAGRSDGMPEAAPRTILPQDVPLPSEETPESAEVAVDVDPAPPDPGERSGEVPVPSLPDADADAVPVEVPEALDL